MTDSSSRSTNEYSYDEVLQKLAKEPYVSVYDSKDTLVAPRYDSIFMPSDMIDTFMIMYKALSSIAGYLFGRFCPLDGCNLVIQNTHDSGKITKGTFLYDGRVFTIDKDIAFEIPNATGQYKLDLKFKIVSGVEEERLRNQFWGSTTFGEIGSDRVVLSSVTVVPGSSSDKDFSLASGVVEGAVQVSTDSSSKTYSLSKTSKTIQTVLR